MALGNNTINEFIDKVLTLLFSAEEVRLKKIKYYLINENRKLCSNKSDGFYYQGFYYTDTITGPGHIKTSLDNSLTPSIQKYLSDIKEINFDKERIKQALVLILEPCRTKQDFRDAIPNQLAELLPDFQRMSRTRPEGYSVQDNPRKLKHYNSLREKIEYYAVTRLLY